MSNRIEEINKVLNSIKSNALTIMNSEDFHEEVLNPLTESFEGLAKTTKITASCPNFSLEDEYFTYDELSDTPFRSYKSIEAVEDELAKSVEGTSSAFNKTTIQDIERVSLLEDIELIIKDYQGMYRVANDPMSKADINNLNDKVGALLIVKKIVEDSFDDGANFYYKDEALVETLLSGNKEINREL